MKQIRFDTFGVPPQVARCQEVADPGAPEAWEVLVDIEASAINPADVVQLAGRYGLLPKLPATLGMDAVGRVVSCGAEVQGLAPGDRVLLVADDNWCQRRRITASLVFKIDPGIDILQAAALKVTACTAVELVRHQVALAPGDWLIQTGPLSSVGRAVLQIARHDGLRTLNLVRRAEAVDEVLQAGGHAALVDGPDLAGQVRELTGGAVITLGLDCVGGDATGHVAELLCRGGLLVNYGMLSGQPMRIDCDHAIFRGLTIKGFWLINRIAREPLKERNAIIAEAVELLAKGVLNTPVAATYSLEEIEQALRHAMKPGRQGKVFLLPNGPVATRPVAA